MSERKGEKIGWVGGWIGAFIWIVLLAGYLVVQKRYFMSAISLSIFTTAVILVIYLAPWKHPDVRYWKLILPIYAMLIAGIITLLGCFGFPGRGQVGYSWWSVLWLLPALLPFRSTGKRTWDEANPDDSPEDNPEDS